MITPLAKMPAYISSETQQHNVTSVNGPTMNSVFVASQDGLVSDETLDTVFAVYAWLMPVNSLLTILFCGINAAVYWQQRAATFALYLIGVDIGDGLCAVLKFCSNMAYFILPSHAFRRLLIDWYVARYLAVSFRRMAIILNMLASFERCVAIAFPLKSVSRKVLGKPVVIILTVFLASLAAHSFMAFEYYVVLEMDGRWRLMPTEWKMANPHVFVAAGTIIGIVFAFGPLSAILVLNSMLLVMLRAHASRLKTVRRTRGTNSGDMPRHSSVQRELFSDNPTSLTAQIFRGRRDSQLRENSDDSTVKTAPIPQTKNGVSNGSMTDKTEAGVEDYGPVTTSPCYDVNNRAPDPMGHPRAKSFIPSSTKTPNLKIQNETTVTKMVISFTMVFFLLALPGMLSFLARILLPEYGPEGREANLFKAVSTIAQLVSHLTEPSLFWVSFAFSRHFRRAAFRLPRARWCCGWCLAMTSSMPTSCGDVSNRGVKETLSRSTGP